MYGDWLRSATHSQGRKTHHSEETEAEKRARNKVELAYYYQKEYLSISYAGLTSVPTAIDKCIWLKEVNLSYNQLPLVPAVLTTLPELRKLILGGNKITFCPSLNFLSELTYLDLHGNQLEEFPDVEHLTKLCQIDLERNQVAMMPAYLGNLTHLDYLNLGANKVQLVPAELGCCTRLSYLGLRFNPIKSIPPTVYMQGTTETLKYLREHMVENAQIEESSMRGCLKNFVNNAVSSYSHILAHS